MGGSPLMLSTHGRRCDNIRSEHEAPFHLNEHGNLQAINMEIQKTKFGSWLTAGPAALANARNVKRENHECKSILYIVCD